MSRIPLGIIVILFLSLLAMGTAIITDESVVPISAVSASHTCELRVWVNGQSTGPRFAVDPAQYPELCGTDPTPTPVTPTPTPNTVSTSWHAPGTHDGLNIHEHGDAPPAWVINSANPPFSQNRESHTGYKGVLASSPGGAESYLITHILSTTSARSHGDHDYELWLRSPNTGEVLYRTGVLDFGNPPPLRTVDTGERPIILGERNATDGCETWYSRPGAILTDIGWTICGRYQTFDGTILGGVGSFRTVDWIIPCERLPSNSTLLQHCRTEFGVSRISFLANNRDYSAPGITPIN